MQQTKEYLGRVRDLTGRIAAKQGEVEHLKNIALSITANSEGERVKSSSKPDKMAEAVTGYVEAQREIDELVTSLFAARREIVEVIGKLDNQLYYIVLSMYYLQGKSFAEVAEATHYSYQYILEVHRTAVLRVRDILQNTCEK